MREAGKRNAQLGKNKGCFRKGGQPWNKGERCPQLSGKNNGNWKNGKKKHSQGYIYLLKPDHPFCNKDGYILEQRLIIEAQIGRYLLPTEHCHHLNEVKDDNRPENLMGFVSNSAHIRFHHNPDNVKPSEIIFDGRKLSQNGLTP